MALELTTVTDDGAVFFDGADVVRLTDLNAGTAYEHEGIPFRTLPRPSGERLASVATGPVLSVPPGADPYPEVMNRAAIAEIEAIRPDVVVAKGDLTAHGIEQEYRDFLGFYREAFGDRLAWVRGNHDGHLAAFGLQALKLPGVILAILDTSVPGLPSGRVDAEQVDWLDELGARADRPVLVFGHHHVWDPSSRSRPDAYFGIHPDDSERLVEVVARRPAVVGYFCGHTHRNRVRRFESTGDVPWVEVACVKDFPGTWAEYRVFEGGVLQVNHRIATADAVAWSENCRAMLGGFYPQYAFGLLADRCFPVWTR